MQMLETINAYIVYWRPVPHFTDCTFACINLLTRNGYCNGLGKETNPHRHIAKRLSWKHTVHTVQCTWHIDNMHPFGSIEAFTEIHSNQSINQLWILQRNFLTEAQQLHSQSHTPSIAFTCMRCSFVFFLLLYWFHLLHITNLDRIQWFWNACDFHWKQILMPLFCMFLIWIQAKHYQTTIHSDQTIKSNWNRRVDDLFWFYYIFLWFRLLLLLLSKLICKMSIMRRRNPQKCDIMCKCNKYN